MNEKTPRRAPLALTAEQLDYKDSQARNENRRAKNRLHINKETLTGHENTNVSSLDYEMRRLKHELRGIKQTSGYFVLNHETADDNMRVRHKIKRSRIKPSKKRQPVSKSTDSIYEVRKTSIGHQNATKTVSLPVLPTASSASSDSSAKNSLKSQEYMKPQDINDNSSRVNVTLESKPTAKSINRKLSHSNDINNEIAALAAENDAEKSFNFESRDKNDRLLGVNVEAARNRVQNRLAGNAESTFQVDDDGDLTPYMHVPPDGLPRTAYLLPPLEELLCEAKKARYIRKLRKKDTILEKDDPERELNIDEIFNKNR